LTILELIILSTICVSSSAAMSYSSSKFTKNFYQGWQKQMQTNLQDTVA